MASARLYLLVEEASREFASRLLITGVALEHGFEVIVAPQWVIWENLQNLKSGIIVFKGTNRAQSLRMKRAKDAGFLVAAIDEEAFGISDCTEIIKMSGPGDPEICDLFLAQGEFHARCLAEHHPGAPDWIKVTGNPRADLLGEHFSGPVHAQAKELQETWGNFVLFNSNFGAINPRHGDAVSFLEINERMGAINARDQADIDYHLSRLKWERNNLAAMLDVLGDLASRDFPWPIILRPHPAENIEMWRSGLADLPGVHVIRDGDHRAWSTAAKILVHSGSTTGLEAFLLGGRAISLCTAESRWNEFFTSNLVNEIHRDTKTATRAIFDIADGSAPDTDERRVFQRSLSDHLLVDPERLAAEHVVEALADLRDRHQLATENSPSRETIGYVSVSEAKVDPAMFDPRGAEASLMELRALLGFKDRVEVDLLGPWALRFRGAPEGAT
jgi:surface carbohydrate biosynthesis protein